MTKSTRTPYYCSDSRVKGILLTVEKEYDARSHVTTMLIKSNYDPFILSYIRDEFKRYGYKNEVVSDMELSLKNMVHTRNHMYQYIKCSFDDILVAYDNKSGKMVRVTPERIIEECIHDHEDDVVTRYLIDEFLMSCQYLTIERRLYDAFIATKLHLELDSFHFVYDIKGADPNPCPVVDILYCFIDALRDNRAKIQNDPERLLDIDCEIGYLTTRIASFKSIDWPNWFPF